MAKRKDITGRDSYLLVLSRLWREWVYADSGSIMNTHTSATRRVSRPVLSAGSICNDRFAEYSGQRRRSRVVRWFYRPRIAGRFAKPLPEDRRHPLSRPSSNGGATMLPSSPWLLASQSTGLKERKAEGAPPNPWKWEIYRAGRSSPIKQSPVNFPTMAKASRAGKEALKRLLEKLYS